MNKQLVFVYVDIDGLEKGKAQDKITEIEDKVQGKIGDIVTVIALPKNCTAECMYIEV